MTTGMDSARLGDFAPFNALKSTKLDELLGEIDVREASPGQAIFNKGDTQERAFYLLSGTVTLRDDDRTLGQIVGGSDDARNAIAPVSPRRVSAVALDRVTYFSIDSELLDVMVTLAQTGIYEVGELNPELNGAEGDWMSALVLTKTFQLIPPQNIQMIFQRLKRVNYKAGHVVIRQGDQGDDFYIIRSGRCMVTRETPANREDIDLADLGVGASFGEEALIANEPRNATVTMLTDGILMKLGREDFQSLMNEPMVMSLSPEDADEAVSHGGKWLDVRLPSEFKAFSKPNATNLPLYMLRHKLDTLDRKTPYVIYCDTGRRSSAAAFILNQRGFETAVLRGGLNRGEL